ncbi:MAG: CDP-alcohol phosphatidyltransferase family protein [Proteobacteria bacterium]|nr:CDP-alcohol phosphatidyltransferase family protein [Pseudomonadota bacterium]
MAENASVFRHVPNVISMARIVATPVLIFLALTDREDAYKWLLLAAFISDIVDGLIARTFSITSMLGSRLDTLADTLLWPAAIFGIWVFHPEVMTEHWLVIVLVLGLWAIEMIVAWLRYGKLTSFHAYTIRVSVYGFGIFIMSLFLWGLHPWLLYVASAFNMLGNVEALIIMALLPEWTSDVRGLYWVLQQRKVGTE